RRRHTRFSRDWSSDVCSSDLAYSAYAARAGIKMWTFLTSMVPGEKMRETAIYGGEVIKVTGTYDQAKVVASSFADSKGLFLDRRSEERRVGKECRSWWWAEKD